MRHLLLPLLLLGPAAEPTEPATSSKVTYLCRDCGAKPPVIDGKVDDPAWKLAGPMTDFTVVRTGGKKAAWPTTARLLWDADNLYVSFVCGSDGVRTTITERDGPVWEGEAVELFVCPKGADAFYYEINFNPRNVLFDSRIESWKYEAMARDGMKWAKGFNAAVRSAVTVQKDEAGKVTGWTLEAAVPFRDLDVADRRAPESGAVWLFNTFRVAAPADGKLEYSHWQPVHPEFHRPHQFPRLRFAGRPAPAQP